MAWVRLDDGFTEHKKVLGLSDAAFRLHVHTLCYCARMLTDGCIARVWLCGGKGKKLPKAVDELVESGLWHTDDSGDFRVHDYLSYQPSRSQVKQRQQRAAERMARVRNVRANGDGTDVEQFAKSAPNPIPSHPIPTLPPPAVAPRSVEAGASPARRRNFNAEHEHPRYDVPGTWHRRRVDGLRDGEAGMRLFYKHLDAYVDAHPNEDTEPRFEWLTRHFDAWIRSRMQASSDVPGVEETRKRLGLR